MIHIFLSYRRTDTADVAGRLHDNLRMRLGDDFVFRDVYDVAVGIDWRAHIISTLQESDVVLAIIGPTWLTTTDAKGQRRIDNPQDPVREELDLALEFSIPIIPVLVGNASMPPRDDLADSLKPLCRLNAARLRGPNGPDGPRGPASPSASCESSFRVPQTRSTFHPHAQRTTFGRHDAHLQSRLFAR